MGQHQDRIDWISTGRRGFELAVRLLNSGYDVAVWNRTRGKAEPVASLGATIVDQPADLADRDIVVTMVSSSDVFTSVTLGDAGLLTVDAPSQSCSSTPPRSRQRRPTTCMWRPASSAASCSPRRLAAARRSSGRVAWARSFPAPERPTSAPSRLLERFGSTVSYVGENDHARLAKKICHNLILGVVTQILAETTVLAERAGIPRSSYLEFINDSMVGSVFSRYKTPGMVNLDYNPTFTGHLLRKDFELGLEAARALNVPLPVSAQVHQQVVDMIGNGLGDVDFLALLEMAARGSGLELTSEEPDDVSERRPS